MDKNRFFFSVKTKEQIVEVETLAFDIWHEHYIPIIGICAGRIYA